MPWSITPIIDKSNPQFGIVATVPVGSTTTNIWQDTTNPPSNLDMGILKLELSSLMAGFYTFPERRIFAEVIDNG